MLPCPFCAASAGAVFKDFPDGEYYAECSTDMGGCGLVSASFPTAASAAHWWQTGTPYSNELVRTDEEPQDS